MVSQFLVKSLRKVVAIAAIALLATSCSGVFLSSTESNPWKVIDTANDATFSDVAFTGDRNHGWLVGNHNTLLETLDGGNTWVSKSLDLEGNHTLTSVSFADQEGWVTGQPSLLLHTKDGGQSWERIQLSAKLPGEPFMITALGPNSAEMATDVGAIYVTQNSGSNWTALVEAAIGVLRNINRSEDGQYVAVSSRGNFYSTWQPGQRTWQPHNRQNSRRLQNMGFSADGNFWLIARGGQIRFGTNADTEEWQDPINPELSTSWGLLDIAYRTADEIWVSGGSGSMLYSPDGGKSWQKDSALENVPSNLYRIVFISPDQGFVMGQRGILLKYEGDPQSV
ncbi:MAG: photosynthesis system II assembly factor Ycf48 [Cyanobacteria bacterium P01_A01_bin.123]